VAACLTRSPHTRPLSAVDADLWTKFNSKRPAIASFACFLVRCCRLAGESADFVPGSPDEYAAAARALAHFPGADHANSTGGVMPAAAPTHALVSILPLPAAVRGAGRLGILARSIPDEATGRDSRARARN